MIVRRNSKNKRLISGGLEVVEVIEHMNGETNSFGGRYTVKMMFKKLPWYQRYLVRLMWTFGVPTFLLDKDDKGKEGDVPKCTP